MINLDEVLPFKFDVTLCTRTYYFLPLNGIFLIANIFQFFYEKVRSLVKTKIVLFVQGTANIFYEMYSTKIISKKNVQVSKTVETKMHIFLTTKKKIRHILPHKMAHLLELRRNIAAAIQLRFLCSQRFYKPLLNQNKCALKSGCAYQKQKSQKHTFWPLDGLVIRAGGS